MPVKLKTITKGKNEGKVRVSTPGGVKSKATTPKNAKSQKRLIDAIEHGYEPKRKRKNGKRKTKTKR
jgi:hypothetical protein